ncbi:MAG TPA: beta-galactosidase [Bryobacteraceae bacterium]|nr:beta-galactosidase [Bryobacteraceae bacterium]
MRLLLCLVLIAGWAPAAELAYWRAGEPPAAKGLAVAPGPEGWRMEAAAGGLVAALNPTHDYFRRAEFRVTAAPAPSGPVWLSVEYLDRGYGLISVSVPVAEHDQWGVAEINSGKLRRATFRLGSGALAAPLRIQGLLLLRAVTLVDSEPPREPIPDVPPAVTFRTSSQRVTTAGADAATPEQLPEALATMRNLLPLARALGFNGIESYVKWNFVERSPGVFDWSFYDAIVDEIERQGLQWFPLLIVGSAYTLPEWYHDSKDNIGFVCLEHGLRNDIQSIFAGTQNRYVQRFLAEFGRHYGSRKALLGIRLGPSGNYGEAQYPARGNWGYKGQPIHTHIGYWAGDPYAAESFRSALRRQYATIEDLNRAWGDHFASFDQVRPFLPVTAATERKRIDFDNWYMGAMSAWCEQWAKWAREAMPHTFIHQSSGGWGAEEIGTDYSYQARSMARLHGGIRLTNESDNFAQNFAITRMASSAARFYGAELGYEPGGFGSARGVAARLFNALTNGAVHLFYYHPNLYGNDQGIRAWLNDAPLLDRRAAPMIDVAAFYPDTAIKLDDEANRYLWASAFLSRAEAMRSATDYDYVSEQMIADGALDRYKVLVFLWGYITEKDVLERIARWVERGGTLIYPERPRGPLRTVEGDLSVWNRWQSGRTGKGKVIFFAGDPEPGDYYARFVAGELRRLPQLRPAVKRALGLRKPAEVYWSVLSHGELALLNFGDEEASVRWQEGKTVRLAPYTIWME